MGAHDETDYSEADLKVEHPEGPRGGTHRGGGAR